jgi:hypothetical protein
VRITYQVPSGNTWTTIVADATPGGDGGFGYFVSHERYRDFTDGSNDTIAGKIFHVDDSPLGLGFPVSGSTVATNLPAALAHRFTLNYPRYGTKAPIIKNADGDDIKKTPTDPAQSQRYTLPVTLTWVFQNGKDYPRINVKVSLASLPGPDRANFDLRAPYGVLNFDNGADNNISTVMWGDRYHFQNVKKPLVRNSSWQWTGINRGARYTALIAGTFEMGLFEPKLFTKSTLADGFAFGRGLTSAQYKCTDQGEVLPCDWEWPYQSAQYSLSYDNNNEPTTFEKIAWGTAPYWGTGSSMTASNVISYDICVVLGQTISGGLTKKAASSASNYSCATATPN